MTLPSDPPPQAAQRFRRTAERVLDAMLELSPEVATGLGDHRFDDRLTDLSPAGQAHRVQVLQDGLTGLDDLDDTVLDDDDRVDLEILRTALTREVWSTGELRAHTHDPLLHLPGEALYPLIVREAGELPDRLAALAARLDGVPQRLSTARDVLREMPRVHVETAITQARGLASMLGSDVEQLAARDRGLYPAVVAARDAAVRALAEYAGWLEAQLPVSDADPRLGDQRYAATIWYTLDTETGPDALLTRAESDLQAVEESIAELASRIAGAPSRPGQVREVLDRLAGEAPVDDASIVPLCERALAEATTRVRELDLVSVPADPAEIILMPPSRRGVAVAYCDPPGPLEPTGPRGPAPAYFAVAPTPDGWPADRVASFYREYNGHMLRNLTVHEAMPGHVVQLAHSARYQGRTRIRHALWSGPFVEGWAVYAESLMAEHGLAGGCDVTARAAGDALRMQQLKMQLRTTINAILDIRVHAHGMTESEAMQLMTMRGHQEEGEAVGKWRRALLTSAQLATYYVGYHEVRDVVEALRRARPQLRERELHDAVLAHGSLSPRHLRTVLGLAGDRSADR
jgi:uncharacterized protein (DUF885 family)